MRWYEPVAVCALALAATGAAWTALVRPERRSEHAAPDGSTSSPSVRVQSAFDLEWCRAEPDPEARRSGLLRLVLEEGATVRGVAGATLFPLKDDRPETARGRPVHMIQHGDVVDVRPWLLRTKPTGPHALRFCARVAGPRGPEYRTGWARIDALDLLTGSVRIHAPRRGTARIHVATESGRSVPGAVLLLDWMPFGAGPLSVGGATEEDGTCLWSGLEDREWTVSLPEGCGPSTEPIRTPFRAPTDLVRVKVPLRDDWTFERVSVEKPFPGQSAVVTGVSSAKDPLPRVWPVSRHLLPGETHSALWLMRPATTELPADLSFEILGMGKRPVLRGDGGALESPVFLAPPDVVAAKGNGVGAAATRRR